MDSTATADRTGTADTAARRRQQQIRQLCAASIRALAADPALDFRGDHLYRGRSVLPLNAPHLYPDQAADGFGSFRGAADGMALRLLHSDAALHARLRPAGQTARLVFELLEQFRAESLAGQPGVVRNLRVRHEAWSTQFHRSGLTETSLGLLLYTVAQVCRSRVTAEPVVAETEDLIEQTRGRLSALLGPDLALLRRTRTRQTNYAEPALAIAVVIESLADTAQADNDGGAERSARKTREQFSLLVDAEDDAWLPETAASGASPTLADDGGAYRAFTTAYDRVQRAASLVRPELLHDYRRRLDKRIADSGVNVALLARRLEPLLCVPVTSGWNSGQEEGMIDGARLSQLVCSPAERRLFQTERHEARPATAVSFLIDCSGSMKQHGEGIAAYVDVFLRALERIGVATEVLGFTTGAWNGGKAARDWKRARSPRRPGRLNEVNHLIFKDADTNWRKARPGIAALLKTTLYREGIDGEAVQWAARRLADRTEEHRILIVLSDGSPADGATALANDEHYLQQHLATVVRGLEDSGAVNVFGVGLGLDMSPYFSRSLILDTERLGQPEGVRELTGLLERSLPPPR
ncbi:cobaltochelatase CobT-related protein [Arthrobacter crystallopoietes]|nr:cobalt chelatase [Arthrobacter crystallopoietes]AUI50889.1 cobalt chelatase [Arthrobacter crystallopoietes]